MSEIDQQFVEYVVKSLVGKPEAVEVNRRIDEKGVLLELTVDPEDLGRVIGKRGATAQSIRTLLRALGTKNDARYNLKIIDNSPEGESRSAPPSDSGSSNSASSNDQADDNPVAQTDDVSDDSAASNDDNDSSEPEPTIPNAPVAEAEEENRTSDRLRQTRAELADLDDLDV